jgi:hypothetical protein
MRQFWPFCYVRPAAVTTLASRGWTFRSRLLEDLKHAVEVDADSDHGRVFAAKGRLAGLKRPLKLHSGPRQISKVLQHQAEVVAPDGYVGMVGAKHRLADRQRPLELHPRARQLPEILQHPSEVVAPD